MSKRVRFDESTDENVHKFPKYGEDGNPNFELKNDQENLPGRMHSSRLKLDNSVDSDEDDDEKEEKYEKLKEDDVEGAEEDYAGEEVGITPFNLKEEMEEGDFDVQGNYHFKKENVIRDEWLDNIDWVNVKNENLAKNEDSWRDDKDPNFNELDVLHKMVELMKPGETVTGALRRLGGRSGKKNQQKRREWRKEKVYDLEAKDEPSNSSDKDQENKKKEMLLSLTGLADEMMGAGHYDVYIDSYEKFMFKIKKLEADKKSKEPQIPDDADDDDALDILGSSIDGTGKESKAVSSETSKENEPEDSTIKWEYKWSDKDEKVYGPYSSQEMADWQGQGYFKEGVLVRRTDREDSQFYPSKRIDFDLYT